jgi:hypothetical protein
MELGFTMMQKSTSGGHPALFRIGTTVPILRLFQNNNNLLTTINP